MGGHGNAEGNTDTAIAQYNKLVELENIKEGQFVESYIRKQKGKNKRFLENKNSLKNQKYL